MDWNTVKQVRRFKNRYFIHGDVLEVGSYNVNGSIRTEFNGNPYTGVDIVTGPGVDHLIPQFGAWHLDKKFDLVISLNTLEHCLEPWQVFGNCANHVKQDGYLFMMAPFSWVYHRHPVDCFRFAPDGLRHLANIYGLTVLDCYLARGSIFINPTHLKTTRLALQHLHGILLQTWRILTFTNVPSIECVLIAQKLNRFHTHGP